MFFKGTIKIVAKNTKFLPCWGILIKTWDFHAMLADNE